MVSDTVESGTAAFAMSALRKRTGGLFGGTFDPLSPRERRLRWLSRDATCFATQFAAMVGFEVLAMVDLPQGAQPSDAETTLAVAFSRLPEVIGVLEGLGAGLQPDRATADQVTAILGQGGYGLVTQYKGLNTMPKLAVKEGVPAAPVFRDFDSKGQTPTVIRRFLDQAAFKAGIEGSVIMMGRMRPETISALLVWGLQDRASQVALAPVSAVLKNATPE